ncbi:tail fiber domain-containing protein [Enterobacter asburiae]|uniref:Tail fiber domain-containing protein n=1 Tax=Enterobacter asburiae TaxID=61645 RepID=A0AAW7ZN59_ENTAS|nr:tail fiber domain-containing protein [Enterobacter asburiae]MCL8163049.1 tail fiber domain-containing protein [Enterobacter asburiae]MCM7942099.1 tail fiber domain-containing protein [Enterobacter asburiae]MDO7923060.1 tail fiber domain-containing protein [Enterobacter asburiae]MDV0914777.1 tail fiber domain-containing protein [Enterobacter asburiae]MDV0934878.1 tail fiber domain-containing protein [Enterobacter asburiae]
MSAGTITLTNGSAIVGGSGTSFATELAAGDFIVSTVGGVPYTLPVKTVDSNTQLTLVSNFTGPTQSGAAWSAVPRVALNMVTAALVAQSAEALRGLNYDKQNWQSIFSGTGNVTVTLPDGTKWTGLAWNSITSSVNDITSSLSGKAAKGANSDITSLSGLTTALSVSQGGTGSTTASGARTNLGLGNSAIMNVGAAAGTVAAGDDSRLNSVANKTGGAISSPVSISPGGAAPSLTLSQGKNDQGQTMTNQIEFSVVDGYNPNAGFYVNSIKGYWFGTGTYWQIGGARGGGANLQSIVLVLKPDNASNPVNWQFNANGQAVGTWVNSSDRRIKDNINVIPDPLEAMNKLRGYSWRRLDSGATGFGFIAQDVQEVFPEAVHSFGQTMTMEDGTEVKDVLSVDTTGVSAALHHEAILVLMKKVEELTLKVEALQSGS